jgi:hypothetical protein
MIVGLAALVIVGGMIGLLFPMLRELLRPRDSAQFRIDGDFVREPRFFGRALRRALVPRAAPHVEGANARLGKVVTRGGRVHIAGGLSASPSAGFDDVVMTADSAIIDDDAVQPVAYVRGHVSGDAQCTLAALAVDGSVRLGRLSRIEHWLDVDGDLVAADGCILGSSATSSARLELATACTFGRLYGRPIETSAPVGFAPTFVGKVDAADGGNSVAHGERVTRDIISRDVIRIGSNSVVEGSLKSTSDIEIFSGARITGNVFARGSLVIHSGAHVLGTVCVDGNIFLADAVQIGERDAATTAYCGGTASLGIAVRVYGWMIAEQGGTVR